MADAPGRATAARARAVGLALGLLLAGLVVADEARFDPPIDGVFLGVGARARNGAIEITRITPGGPADAAAFRRGDRILRIPGANSFADVDAFSAALGELGAGTSHVFSVARGPARIELQVVLDHGAMRDYFDIVARIERSRFLRRLETMPAALAAIRHEDAARLRAATRWSEAYEVLNGALGRLGVSHSGIVPPWSYERLFEASRQGSGAYRLGLLLAERARGDGDAARAFAIQVLEGGPADRAGVRTGDEIVRVNGLPVTESPRRVLAGYEARFPHFALKVERDERVRLDVRSRRGGETRSLDVVVDEPIDEFTATVASVRAFEIAGRRIAAIHAWDFLNPKLTEVFETALGEGKTGAAEGWIFDLRGRGGRIDVLDRILRILKRDRRPRVLLIDRDTRSAKEILADRLRGGNETRVVGERSAGAVLPTRFVSLSRGAGLMLPDDPRPLRKVFGELDLEGAGVTPDVIVEVELEYGGGEDPIFAAGLRELLELLSGTPRRARF